MRRTNVVERIVDCLEHTASVGKRLLEDSPFARYPVDRPCRSAGQDTDLELDRPLERTRWVGETVERRVGSVLLDLVVPDQVVGHQLDRLRCALALRVACADFPPPSCVVSILCGFP